MRFDIHTHILPEIDDGAKSVEESVALVQKLSSQGVTHIALTSHYYSDQESLEDFLEDREVAYNKFLQVAPKNVTYTLGAEVYFSQYLLNNKSISELCYKGTNKILLEFPYNVSFTGKSEDNLYKVISTYGVSPILPHIERYDSLINDSQLVEYLIDLGCEMQINLSSLDKFSTKRKIIKLFQKGLISYVATDTHSFTRGSEYDKYYNLLLKKVPDFENYITDNSLKLFK